MRIIAIDYGRKRTGIAVTDPLQIAANGLCTVPTAELNRWLTDYLQAEPVETIVLGCPTQTNGADSENMERVNQFATWVRRHFPDIPLVLYDERYTSTLAHRAMLEGGLKKKQRQDKALVDKIAATIILQSYMESRR